jgi:exosortase/archaeosortase family protein
MKKTFISIKQFIKKKKLQPIIDVLLFAIIIYFFHWLWWNGGLKHFLSNYAAFKETEEFLAHQVFLPSAWIVQHIIGYDIHTLHNTLYFPNNGFVAVEGSCSGLKQFYQWTILMILFPGPWRKKLWYIPLGLLTIHLVNILRIVTLSVVVMHWPQQWDFIHLWILRPFYYVVMFGMWVIWVEKIRPSLKKQ